MARVIIARVPAVIQTAPHRARAAWIAAVAGAASRRAAVRRAAPGAGRRAGSSASASAWCAARLRQAHPGGSVIDEGDADGAK